MSTKNMARTVIEGSRQRSYQAWIRSSHSAARVGVRAQLARVRCAEDAEDKGDFADEIPTHLPGGCSEFKWKLSSLRRWLRSHVGRPWNETFSEFQTRYGRSRHRKGQRLLRERLWWTVEREPTRFGLFIDEHGILRDGRSLPDKYIRPRSQRIDYVDRKELGTWLHGRLIGTHDGRKFYWFESTTRGFRQAAELNFDELLFLKRVHPMERSSLSNRPPLSNVACFTRAHAHPYSKFLSRPEPAYMIAYLRQADVRLSGWIEQKSGEFFGVCTRCDIRLPLTELPV